MPPSWHQPAPKKLPLKGPVGPSGVKATQKACVRSTMCQRSFTTHLGLAETDPHPPSSPPARVRACEEAAHPLWKAARERSGCTGRGRRGCREEGNQASRACKGGGGDVCSLGATSIPVAVRTSLWKRSVTFTWEKLGDFISGFW